MREAFERAIREHPDDRTGYAAYADWLQEQGDPRGEFMAVQLALEDETASKTDRDRLKAREAELLAAHEREWLGDLAPYLLDHEEYDRTKPHTDHQWRFGTLASLHVQCLTTAFARLLATTTPAHLLRELRVSGEARYFSAISATEPPQPQAQVPGIASYWELLELVGSLCLRNLRVFQMGDVDGEPPEDGWTDNHTYAPGIDRLIAGMPRVEELHLLCKEYDAGALFALPNLTRVSDLSERRPDRMNTGHLGRSGYGDDYHTITHPPGRRPVSWTNLSPPWPPW